MRRLRAAVVAFGRFWYDFVIGDDWRIAAGVVVVLVTGGIAVATGVVPDAGIALAVTLGIGLVLAASLAHGARR